MVKISKIQNEVNMFNKNMAVTGSCEGRSALVRKVGAADDVTISARIDMINSISLTFNRVMGNKVDRPFSAYELSRRPF